MNKDIEEKKKIKKIGFKEVLKIIGQIICVIALFGIIFHYTPIILVEVLEKRGKLTFIKLMSFVISIIGLTMFIILKDKNG